MKRELLRGIDKTKLMQMQENLPRLLVERERVFCVP